MENKNIAAAKPTSLYINSTIAAIIAIAVVYVSFLDDYLHSLLFLLNYVLLFGLIIAVASAFKKGQKEIVKAGAASILTIEFIFHATAITDMISLNYYYFFSGNFFITAIGVLTFAIFILFIFVYINHFRINASNNSNLSLVQTNKTLLLFIIVFSAIVAILVAVMDNKTGRELELHLILTYIMHIFISFIIISVETMINVFRSARELGILSEVITSKVGAKAARVSGATRSTSVGAKAKAKARVKAKVKAKAKVRKKKAKAVKEVLNNTQL